MNNEESFSTARWLTSTNVFCGLELEVSQLIPDLTTRRIISRSASKIMIRLDQLSAYHTLNRPW